MTGIEEMLLDFVRFFDLAILDLAILGWIFAGAYYLIWRFHQRRKAIEFAKWIANEGQFEPLPKNVLDEAILKAEADGKYEHFIAWLNLVVREHGLESIKNGHLYWIWDRMNKKVNVEDVDAGSVPSFRGPNNVK